MVGRSLAFLSPSIIRPPLAFVTTASLMFMPTSCSGSKTPDPVVSNCSLPSENMTTEDKKKSVVKKSKKEEKLINPPSIIKAEEECICMDVCVKCELASINSSKHKFCFSWIGKWADRENTCPLCKERFILWWNGGRFNWASSFMRRLRGIFVR